MTHVCFVSQNLNSFLDESNQVHIGGAERQQFLISKMLSDRDIDISYIISKTGSDDSITSEIGDVHDIIPTNGGYFGAPWKYLSLFKTIREVDADIYYVRASPILCVFVDSITQILNKNFVYCVASDNAIEPNSALDPNRGLFSHFKYSEYTQPVIHKAYMNSISNANHVFVLSEYQQNILKDNYDISATVAPVGYTLPDATEITHPNERDYFFWAGRIVPAKNPDALLNVAEKLCNIKFVMGGAISKETNYSRKIVEKAKSIPNIEYLGMIDPEEIHSYFKHARGFLQTTSTKAGFGNTTLEAWRYGTPVISLYSSFDGYIEDKDLGIYADGSIKKLKEAIIRLEKDNKATTTLGWNGREFLRENFLLEDIVNEYENVFTTLIDN